MKARVNVAVLQSLEKDHFLSYIDYRMEAQMDSESTNSTSQNTVVN
jgi:hypothetical protein